MRPLVLALAAFVGWAAFNRYQRAHRQPRLIYGGIDAVPFPTSASQGRIELDDAGQVRDWCEALQCTEEQLRAAVRHGGDSVQAVRRHLERTR